MRHRCRTKRLGRTTSHRTALLKNLTKSLIKHKAIKTTLPKAKVLRGFAEKIITTAKSDSDANRKRVFAVLRDESLVHELFTEVAVRSKERPGGYLRVLKCGYRPGDSAPMAYVQLVDYAVSQ